MPFLIWKPAVAAVGLELASKSVALHAEWARTRVAILSKYGYGKTSLAEPLQRRRCHNCRPLSRLARSLPTLEAKGLFL